MVLTRLWVLHCTSRTSEVNSPWEKVKNLQNASWFANAKVYSQLPFLVVAKGRENRIGTESTALDREKLIVAGSEWQTQTLVLLWRPVWESFAEFTQNGCRNFRPVFTSPRRGSNSLSFPIFHLVSLQRPVRSSFSLSPPLSFTASNLFPIYHLPIPPSCGQSLNLVSKQLITKTITQHP